MKQKTKKILANLAWIVGSTVLTVLFFYWIWHLPADIEIPEGAEGTEKICLVICSFLSLLFANAIALVDCRAIGSVNAWISAHLSVIIYLCGFHFDFSPWFLIAFCSVSVIPTYFRKSGIEDSKAKIKLYGHYITRVLIISYVATIISCFFCGGLFL